jgi:hypothetical protein
MPLWSSANNPSICSNVAAMEYQAAIYQNNNTFYAFLPTPPFSYNSNSWTYTLLVNSGFIGAINFLGLFQSLLYPGWGQYILSWTR